MHQNNLKDLIKATSGSESLEKDSKLCIPNQSLLMLMLLVGDPWFQKQPENSCVISPFKASKGWILDLLQRDQSSSLDSATKKNNSFSLSLQLLWYPGLL